MKTIAKSLSSLLLMLLCISCGASSKQVNYVYVDAPKTDPHPTRTTSVDNSEYLSNSTYSSSSAARTTSVTNSYEPTSSSFASSAVSSPSNQSNKCAALAAQEVPGVFRGYGMGRSTNLTAAKNIALRVAQQEALSKISTMLETLEDINMESIDEQGKSVYILKMKTHIKGIINNTKVVRMDMIEGKVNEVHYCVQVSASDVINLLQEDLSSLNSKDRENVTSVINGQYLNR